MRTVVAVLATALLFFDGSGPAGHSCPQWCPGDPNPAGRPVPWDGGVCHDYYWDYYGVQAINTGAFYSWKDMPWG